MRGKVHPLWEKFSRDLESVSSSDQLSDLRDEYLGRKRGLISLELKKLSVLSSEERPLVGQKLNELKEQVEQSLLEKKSYFEVIYTSVVRIEDGVKEKKDLQKIVLCDVPTEIYTELEKILLNLLSDSGYPGVKFDKKVDFTKLFKEKFN